MSAPNIFKSLLPHPTEDDFTSALALLVDPSRDEGPEVLRYILDLVPGVLERFDLTNYSVSKQRTTSSGRFDILLRSPALTPRTQVVVENKVDLSLDDRSIESIRKYLQWLKDYEHVANFLVLNTKYSVPEGADVPEGIIVIHWHMIGKKVRDFLGSLSSGKADAFSKDFLEFLVAHDMGPLDQLNFQDGAAFRDFRTTKMKFDYILESVKSHFEALGYKVSKTVDLAYEEPYYGVVLKKGAYSDLFDNEMYFIDRKTGDSRSLLFVCQTYIEKKFYDFILSKYSGLVGEVTKRSEIVFDDAYYWTISKNVEEGIYSDLEAEKDDLLKFSIDGLKRYQEKLLPLLEKAAKQYRS